MRRNEYEIERLKGLLARENRRIIKLESALEEIREEVDRCVPENPDWFRLNFIKITARDALKR